MKTAVVTGPSSGIGSAVAQALLHDEWKVYGISRTKPQIENRSFTWLKCDLTNKHDIKRSLELVKEPVLDALISNAGIVIEERASAVSVSSYEHTFAVNVLAPMLIVRALRTKIQRASIISVSSVSDRLPGEGLALYCSSKAANTLFFNTLAKELTGARVYTLLPDYVDTPMLRNAPPHEANFDWARIIQPHALADFTVKLARGDEKLESGANIIVVSEALKSSFESQERLYGINTDTGKLTKLSR